MFKGLFSGAVGWRSDKSSSDDGNQKLTKSSKNALPLPCASTHIRLRRRKRSSSSDQRPRRRGQSVYFEPDRQITRTGTSSPDQTKAASSEDIARGSTYTETLRISHECASDSASTNSRRHVSCEIDQQILRYGQQTSDFSPDAQHHELEKKPYHAYDNSNSHRDVTGHVEIRNKPTANKQWDIARCFRSRVCAGNPCVVTAPSRTPRPEDNLNTASSVVLPACRSSSLGLIFFKLHAQFITLPETTEWAVAFDPPPIRPRLPVPPTHLLEKPWGNVSDSIGNSGRIKPDGIAYLRIPFTSWLPNNIMDWGWRTSSGFDLRKNPKKIVRWNGYQYDNAAIREEVAKMGIAFGVVWMEMLQAWLHEMESYIHCKLQYDRKLVQGMATSTGIRWYSAPPAGISTMSFAELCIDPMRMDFLALLRDDEARNLGNQVISTAIEDALRKALALAIDRN